MPCLKARMDGQDELMRQSLVIVPAAPPLVTAMLNHASPMMSGFFGRLSNSDSIHCALRPPDSVAPISARKIGFVVKVRNRLSVFPKVTSNVAWLVALLWYPLIPT